MRGRGERALAPLASVEESLPGKCRHPSASERASSCAGTRRAAKGAPKEGAAPTLQWPCASRSLQPQVIPSTPGPRPWDLPTSPVPVAQKRSSPQPPPTPHRLRSGHGAREAPRPPPRTCPPAGSRLCVRRSRRRQRTRCPSVERAQSSGNAHPHLAPNRAPGERPRPAETQRDPAHPGASLHGTAPAGPRSPVPKLTRLRRKRGASVELGRMA